MSSQNPTDTSDQATLFLELGENTWLKTGLEYDGQLLSGAVVTFPYSDWSVHPHPGGFQKYTVNLKNRELRVYEGDVMIREVNVFGDDQKKARVGIMGCSPLGKGAAGTYRNFTLKHL